MLRALGEGGGGAEAIHLLKRGQLSRNLLLVRAMVHLAAAKRHPSAADAAIGYALLDRLREQAPQAANRLLLAPTTGAWALHTVVTLNQDDHAAAEPGRLAELVCTELRGAPPQGPRIGACCEDLAIDLLMIPVSGLHFPGADLDVAAVSDPGTVARWQERISAGWELLVQRHRPRAVEAGLVLTALAPLLEPPVGHVSGTFRHAFGLVAMSLPPDGRAAAVTLAHELQHAKLAALTDLFPLLRARTGERYYAPWRLDPRPLPALLHGAYAHLGVAGFWRSQRHHERTPDDRLAAEVEFARWRAAAADTTRILLDSGSLTPVGQEFVMAMAAMLDGWLAEPVSAQASTQAQRLLAAHRTRWLAVNTG